MQRQRFEFSEQSIFNKSFILFRPFNFFEGDPSDSLYAQATDSDKGMLYYVDFNYISVVKFKRENNVAKATLNYNIIVKQ